MNHTVRFMSGCSFKDRVLYWKMLRTIKCFANSNFKVRQCAEMYGEYRPLFEGVGSGPGDSTLEDKLYEYEVTAYVLTKNCVG